MTTRAIKIRQRHCSFLIPIQPITALFVLLLLALFVALLSLRLGESNLSWFDVGQALLGKGTPYQDLLVNTLRLPRVLLAIFAGGCLAIAGYLLQNLTRVSLASPDILGMSDGAACAVTAFLAAFAFTQGAVDVRWLPLAAFLGALLAVFLVYSLSIKHSQSQTKLILSGILIAALMKAGVVLMMVAGPIYTATQAQLWLIGTLNQTNPKEVAVLVPTATLLVLVVLARSRYFTLARLDNTSSFALGLNLAAHRKITLLLAALMTGVSVAFAGALGFVGLIVPHLIGKIMRDSGAITHIAGNFLGGALLTLCADLAGRMLFLPHEIPAGVFTSMIGAPFFIYLIIRSGRSS